MNGKNRKNWWFFSFKKRRFLKTLKNCDLTNLQRTLKIYGSKNLWLEGLRIDFSTFWHKKSKEIETFHSKVRGTVFSWYWLKNSTLRWKPILKWYFNLRSKKQASDNELFLFLTYSVTFIVMLNVVYRCTGFVNSFDKA